MSTYAERIAHMLPFEQRFAAEYEHYARTMDAICSRKPERMKENGMEMLRSKVLQLEHPILFNSALEAYITLKKEVEEVHHA